MRNEYVTGFLFDDKCKLVALVLKETPEWMKGKYTGVGGKLKHSYSGFGSETPMECMHRECWEEYRWHFEWKQFAMLHGNKNRDGAPFAVHMFKAFHQAPALILPTHLTTEGGIMERIDVLPIWQVRPTNSIPNVPWLIQMALSIHHDTVASFNIEETY